MSRKLPLYAVDTYPLTVRVPVEVKVKLDGMAEETGIPASSIAATGIVEMVKDRPFGAQELMRVNEIIQENIRKRDLRKARKGAL
ncbi:MAG: hypothetical protein IKO55_16920 [Kiritimatiellae bacterium]|nr:hypothetical protein [Kiritimatiellia bacterium]